MLERGTLAVLQRDHQHEAQRQRQVEGMDHLPVFQILELDGGRHGVGARPIERGMCFNLPMQIAQPHFVVTGGDAREQRDQRNKYGEGMTGSAPATRTGIAFAPALEQQGCNAKQRPSQIQG